MLQELDYSDEAIIEALLHDTLEDTDATPTEVADLFGVGISTGVEWLSEPSKVRGDSHKITKPVRKVEFLINLEKAPVQEKNIKLADIIDNTTDFVKYYEHNTPRAERFYFAKMQMLALLRVGTDPVLYRRADKTLLKLLDKITGKET